jgi:tripartite-type tricarboxylate transporter receptor subunit TctC
MQARLTAIVGVLSSASSTGLARDEGMPIEFIVPFSPGGCKDKRRPIAMKVRDLICTVR